MSESHLYDIVYSLYDYVYLFPSIYMQVTGKYVIAYVVVLPNVFNMGYIAPHSIVQLQPSIFTSILITWVIITYIRHTYTGNHFPVKIIRYIFGNLFTQITWKHTFTLTSYTIIILYTYTHR